MVSDVKYEQEIVNLLIDQQPSFYDRSISNL